jgi:hypothetical protein
MAVLLARGLCLEHAAIRSAAREPRLGRALCEISNAEDCLGRLQPVDAPNETTTLNDAIAQLGSDALLLFSSDFPHWQFEADDVLPEGLSDQLLKKILVDNPLATYPRLKETVA